MNIHRNSRMGTTHVRIPVEFLEPGWMPVLIKATFHNATMRTRTAIKPARPHTPDPHQQKLLCWLQPMCQTCQTPCSMGQAHSHCNRGPSNIHKKFGQARLLTAHMPCVNPAGVANDSQDTHESPGVFYVKKENAPPCKVMSNISFCGWRQCSMLQPSEGTASERCYSLNFPCNEIRMLLHYNMDSTNVDWGDGQTYIQRTKPNTYSWFHIDWPFLLNISSGSQSFDSGVLS